MEKAEMFSFHELLPQACSGLIASWLLKIIQTCLFSTWFTLCRPSLVRLGFWYQANINQFPFWVICWACTSSKKKTLECSHGITSQANNFYFYHGQSFSDFQESPKREKSERLSTAIKKMLDCSHESGSKIQMIKHGCPLWQTNWVLVKVTGSHPFG